MRLMPWTGVYEAHRPSCMTLIDCMRTKLIHEVCMSLIENVCRGQQISRWHGMQGRAGWERTEEEESSRGAADNGGTCWDDKQQNIAARKGRAGRVRASGEGRVLRGIGRGGGGVPRVQAVCERKGMAVAGSAGVGEKERGGSGTGRAKGDGGVLVAKWRRRG